MFTVKTERNETLWRECVEQGLSRSEVAARHGISPSRVRDIIVRMGVGRRYKVLVDGHMHPVRTLEEVRQVWLSLQPKVPT